MCLNKNEWQVERKIDLVYGGGSIGLMGLVSQAVHDGGRHVLGYPHFFPMYASHRHVYAYLFTNPLAYIVFSG